MYDRLYFSSPVYEYHQCAKMGRPLPAMEDYHRSEEVWLGFYGIGKLEAYQFIYQECTGVAHLQTWLTGLLGEAKVKEAALAFAQWTQGKSDAALPGNAAPAVLDEDQRQQWLTQGYLRVGGLVPPALCDAVAALICHHLSVDILDPATWYNAHPDWHGLMLQVYQDTHIHAIRSLPAIRNLFAALYATNRIVANTEKVSFNPPETGSWKFRHSSLHWDIDFQQQDLYYIQGLVYLNEVPENRGPLTLVPGFHRQFDNWMKIYPDPQEALQAMRENFNGVPIAGRKGDVVLWLQTLPHAASANRDVLPRFVQYVSFSKL